MKPALRAGEPEVGLTRAPFVGAQNDAKRRFGRPG